MGYFVWDPNPQIFSLPILHHAITWYGLLFALGFFLAYFIVRSIFYNFLQNHLGKEHTASRILSTQLTDRLTVLIILGTILGARLGHVFFYDWSFYKTHPIEIFKIWEGGLASHGAAIGNLVAILIFAFWTQKKIPQFNYLVVLDAVVIPIPLVGALIRIGNFINQEILGKPTKLPWGVIFIHPLEKGISGVPLHPVQIYESIFYFFVFLILFGLWKKKPDNLGSGRIAALFFIFIFGFRYFIEYLKLPQSDLINESIYGNMGQLLSIPFVIVGIILLFFSFYKRRT